MAKHTPGPGARPVIPNHTLCQNPLKKIMINAHDSTYQPSRAPVDAAFPTSSAAARLVILHLVNHDTHGIIRGDFQ